MLNISGLTKDNNSVIKGVLTLVETYGLPLDIIVENLESKNMVVDWIDFYENAVKCNWNIKTIFLKIEMTLLDIKGKKYTDEVILRLHHYLNKREI